MPEEGLDEAIENLGYMVRFYRENAEYQLPESESAHRGMGEISKTSERLPLVIAE